MIALRKYQIDAVNLLREGFKKHQRQVLTLPTGSGKTVIFSHMVASAYAKGTQTLILTDRIELLNQTMKSIATHNIPIQILNADTKNFYPAAPITISMIETLKRRMKKWQLGYYNPTLLVIDESHRGNFTSILDAFPQSKVIGCTATPIGKHFFKYYQNIVSNIYISELIEQGFLCKCKAYQAQDSFDDVEVKHGEFVEKQLFTHFDKPSLYSGVLKEWKEKCNGTKTLIFNVNIAHAEKTNEEFNKAGIHSEVVTSKTPKEERNRILKAFDAGHFPVLQNCGILVAGWDCPSLQTVVVNRATMSLTLWLQMLGRASRPYPGKEFFTCLDFGQNHTRHGLYSEDRIWELAPPKKKKKGVAPVKSCPKCSAMLAASARKCEYCGYEFPKPTHEQKEGVLVEVQPKIPDHLRGRNISSLSVDELVEVSKSKAISKPFIWRVVRSKGEEAIKKYSWDMGYREGWTYNQLKEMDDVKFRDRIL